MNALSRRCLAVFVFGLGAFTNIACVSGQLDSAMQQAATIAYVDDEGEDYWQSPDETVARGAGDCEDQAIYLHHLLGLKGLRSEVVFGIENLKQRMYPDRSKRDVGVFDIDWDNQMLVLKEGELVSIAEYYHNLIDPDDFPRF